MDLSTVVPEYPDYGAPPEIGTRPSVLCVFASYIFLFGHVCVFGGRFFKLRRLPKHNRLSLRFVCSLINSALRVFLHPRSSGAIICGTRTHAHKTRPSPHNCRFVPKSLSARPLLEYASLPAALSDGGAFIKPITHRAQHASRAHPFLFRVALRGSIRLHQMCGERTLDRSAAVRLAIKPARRHTHARRHALQIKTYFY